MLWDKHVFGTFIPHPADAKADAEPPRSGLLPRTLGSWALACGASFVFYATLSQQFHTASASAFDAVAPAPMVGGGWADALQDMVSYQSTGFHLACTGAALLVVLCAPLGLLAAVLAPALELLPARPTALPYPPRWPVLWRALRGEFRLEEFGPVECLRQAHGATGEIFRICLPTQPCTFLVGPAACEFWFKQPNDIFNPAGAYRSFMRPVFGPRVVYDAPWPRMASQLRFVKHGTHRTPPR
jgi:hypothetical protein